MAVQLITAADALARLADFSTIIDARSESEFAEDHLPHALNWPSLHDDERQVVGTEYKQVNAFEAKKRGAAMVARNVAAHIEREVLDKPKEWRPLVYCWRGGKRSGSLALILDQIGFKTTLIEGGYKAFRAAVVEDISRLAPLLNYRVICGTTGSGKTRLLHALAAEGAQVLDLEGLANHRSSVLGVLPGQPQPSQKQFDTRIWHALTQFDPQRPVFVESESKKVGNVAVPETLMAAVRASECLSLQLPDALRVQLLLEDYDFFVKDPEFFCHKLDALVTQRGKEVIEDWKARVRSGRVNEVVAELLHKHYDPVYVSSMQRNFKQFGAAKVIAASAINMPAFGQLAKITLQETMP
jgi:tRNA 2-selenouridine synthase